MRTTLLRECFLPFVVIAEKLAPLMVARSYTLTWHLCSDSAQMLGEDAGKLLMPRGQQQCLEP